MPDANITLPSPPPTLPFTIPRASLYQVRKSWASKGYLLQPPGLYGALGRVLGASVPAFYLGPALLQLLQLPLQPLALSLELFLPKLSPPGLALGSLQGLFQPLSLQVTHTGCGAWPACYQEGG